MKQRLIDKYAKKFVGKETTIFYGVHYAVNGCIYATNRQYALRIENAHELAEPVTLDARTGKPIKGEYPDCERVFKVARSDTLVEIPSRALPNIIKLVRCAADISDRVKVPHVRLITHNSRTVELRHTLSTIGFIALWEGAEAIGASGEWMLNSEYLLTALSVMSDAKAEPVTIKLGSPYEPIIVTDSKDIDVLILPYRMPDMGRKGE